MESIKAIPKEVSFTKPTSIIKDKDSPFVFYDDVVVEPKRVAPIVTGGFYELADGRIARVYTYTPTKVGYYFDGDRKDAHRYGEMSHAQLRACTYRGDLKDFPNAIDPLLPYAFNLFWDIKHHSELRKAVQSGHEEMEDIKFFMNQYGIVLK